MKMQVNAFMCESDGITQEQLEQLKTFAGKNAGISQLRDGYFGTDVSNPEKAAPRFVTTTKMGHTSIAGHAKIEVIFENASRMFAMIMNSLQYYDTTEKSGRFTEMTGNNPEQCALYDKWNQKFKKRILEVHPDYNDRFIEKQLKDPDHIRVENGRIYDRDTSADITDTFGIKQRMDEIMDSPRLPVNTRSQENARYILSIFTKSTTFGYTTSLDQWNFIYDWCHKYTDQFGTKGDGILLRIGKDNSTRPATWFEQNVYNDLMNLAGFIRDNLYCPTIRDHKKREFDMLTSVINTDHPMKNYYGPADEHIGFSYTTDYYASFIVLSHVHRHRTLKYWMQLGEKPGCYGFFVPPFIRNHPMETEWLSDMESVKDLYPQGMLIHIIEAGTLDNFALKAAERFCGCAMWETMETVKNTGLKFAEYYDSGIASELEKAYIERFYDPETCELKTKAAITDGCHEGCYFGCAHALDRIV